MVFILLRSTPIVTKVRAISGDRPVMMTLAPIRPDASTVCTRWLATVLAVRLAAGSYASRTRFSTPKCRGT